MVLEQNLQMAFNSCTAFEVAILPPTFAEVTTECWVQIGSNDLRKMLFIASLICSQCQSPHWHHFAIVAGSATHSLLLHARANNA